MLSFLLSNLLLVITDAVTTLTYTSSSPAPSSVTCNDLTGCDINCDGNNVCEQTTINAESALYLTLTASGTSVLSEAAINCPDNGECTITATGSDAGYYMIVNCGVNGVCDISGYGTQSLYMMQVNADVSTKLTVTADGGYKSFECEIFCPRNQAQPSCIARVRSDSSPYFTSAYIMRYTWFYVDSINDIELQCDADTDWGALFDPDRSTPNTIFYYSNTAKHACDWDLDTYSSSDFFGTHSFTCFKGSDRAAMDNMQCVPWFTSAPTTAAPTPSPTLKPTTSPTTKQPTKQPTVSPTPLPTTAPTKTPTSIPTVATQFPSKSPSNQPTESPTHVPTLSPSKQPTSTPTLSTTAPSRDPTVSPSKSPSNIPTISPSTPPTSSPTLSTTAPSTIPSVSPTELPTQTPTKMPTETPTSSPTWSTPAPSTIPSVSPTKLPTQTPTQFPTKSPTKVPTQTPTSHPTLLPSVSPTQPTDSPINDPIAPPTSFAPTISPTVTATKEDSDKSDKEANDINAVDPTTISDLTSNYIFWILLVITMILCFFAIVWIVFIYKHCIRKRRIVVESNINSINMVNTMQPGSSSAMAGEQPGSSAMKGERRGSSSLASKISLPESVKGTLPSSHHERVMSDSEHEFNADPDGFGHTRGFVDDGRDVDDAPRFDADDEHEFNADPDGLGATPGFGDDAPRFDDGHKMLSINRDDMVNKMLSMMQNNMAQCTDCSQYKEGKIYEENGLFYCNECWSNYGYMNDDSKEEGPQKVVQGMQGLMGDTPGYDGALVTPGGDPFAD